MITIVVLLLAALVTFLLAPVALGRGSWRIHHPEVCLLGWYALFLVGNGCVLAAILRAVALGMRERSAFENRGWVEPTVEVMAVWVALAVSGAALSLIGTKLMAMIVAERRARTDFRLLAEHATTLQARLSGLTVHVVDSVEPVVCSMRSRSSELLVSTAITSRLTSPQLRALVAHEAAHLRGLHDIASRVAALNAACLPGLLTPRSMDRSVRLLIELAADRAAAKRVGRREMIAVLEVLGDLCPAGTLRLRAQVLMS